MLKSDAVFWWAAIFRTPSLMFDKLLHLSKFPRLCDEPLEESPPTVVSRASSTALDCFVFARVARFWCIRRRYHCQDIQTYCTTFMDDLLLNEWFNLSCECAVVRDDVASIRIYNCIMALTVNCPCADQSVLDSIPIISRPLHTHRPPWWRMNSPEAVL